MQQSVITAKTVKLHTHWMLHLVPSLNIELPLQSRGEDTNLDAGIRQEDGIV